MKVVTMLKLWWHADGTKILGWLGNISTLISGALLIDGLIPADQIKFYLLGNLALNTLVIKRGYVNTRNIKATQASNE